jgi:anaerobic selenocysteine-containing dehydrogenase
MTNHWNDIDNSSCVLVMGANPAENHPACMAHINAARYGSKRAKLVVVDPRKTRTAMQCDETKGDKFVRIRPGTDIAFFNGVIHWIIDNIATYNATAWQNMQDFHNTATDVLGASSDNQNPPGMAGGFQRGLVKDADGVNINATLAQWQAAFYTKEPARVGADGPFSHGWPKYTDSRMKVDAAKKDYVRDTLNVASATIANVPVLANAFTETGTVFDQLKTHVGFYDYAGTGAGSVADICGCTPAEIAAVAQIVIDHSRFNSPDFGLQIATPSASGYKAMTWLYAMGQTQHTCGGQNVRAGAVLQTLMGNMGRAGGGVNALRGIHNVQGSTDMGLLFDSIPAYSGNPTQDDTFAGYMNALFGNRLGGPALNWQTVPNTGGGLQQLGFKFMTKKFFGDGTIAETVLAPDVTGVPADVFKMGDSITGTPYYGFTGMQIVNRVPDASTDAYLVSIAGFKMTQAALAGLPDDIARGAAMADGANWDTLVFRTANPGVKTAYTYVGKSDARAEFAGFGATGQPESGAYCNDGDVYYGFINTTDGSLYRMHSADGLTWVTGGPATYGDGRCNGGATDPQITEPRVIRDGLGGFWVWGIEMIAGSRTNKIIYSSLKKVSDTAWSFLKSDGTPGYDVVQIDGADSAGDANPFVVYSAGHYQLYWTRGGDVRMSQSGKRTEFKNSALIHDSSLLDIDNNPSVAGGYENGVVVGGTSVCYTKWDPAKVYFPFNDVKAIQKPWFNNTDALFSLWPKNNGFDHITSFRKMKDSKIRAAYVLGQNPAVTEPNQSAVRAGLEQLDLLVVQDMYETETATCKRKAAGVTYLLPACSHVEEAGSVTNSGRWLQWRQKAIQPKGNSKADLELVFRLSQKLEAAGAFNHIDDVWNQIGFHPADRWQALFGRYIGKTSSWTPVTDHFEDIGGSRATGMSGTTALTGTEYVADVVFEEMCKPNSGVADGATIWIYCRAYNTSRTAERPAVSGGVAGESVVLSGTTPAALAKGASTLYAGPTVTQVVVKSLDGLTTYSSSTDYTLVAGTNVAAATIARRALGGIPDGATVSVDYWYAVDWSEANRAKCRNNTDFGLANTYGRWGWAWLYNRRVFYNNLEVPCDEADAFVAPGYLARLYVIHTNTFADFSGSLSYRAYSTLADKASVQTAAGQRHYLTGRFPGHTEPLETPRDGTGTASDLVTTWGRNKWSDGNGVAHPTYPTGTDGQTLDSGTAVGTAHDYKYVLTTIRCVEHFQGGPITRNNSYNVEAEPVPWVEINSIDAAAEGITDGMWVNVITARSNSFGNQTDRTNDPAGHWANTTWAKGFKARVGVGLQSNQRVGRGVVAIPWHWGDQGLGTGSRANDLCVDAFDANTRIPEYKACLCKLSKLSSDGPV